jgi:hypothetical protein
MTDIFQGVTQVVQQIYDRCGEVKASVLVDEARPEESPAHPAFEWRDGVAAEEYRLHQARQLIRRVSVIYEDEPTKLINVPVICSTDAGKEGSYKPTEVVVSEPDFFEAALNAAVQRLRSAQVAVDDLQRAASRLEPSDRNVIIAQVSNALAALNVALNRVTH